MGAHAIRCPQCQALSPTDVVDSRPMFETIKRRRYCTECKQRFTTFEVTADDFAALEHLRRIGNLREIEYETRATLNAFITRYNLLRGTISSITRRRTNGL